MGTLAIFCVDAELPEAVQQFALFEDLGVHIERIENLSQLHAIAELEGLVIQVGGNAWACFDLIRQLRSAEQNFFLPVLIFLPEISNYTRAVSFDFEYVLPCTYPLLSQELVPGLKKLVWFARKKRLLLQKRSELEACMRSRGFENFNRLLTEFGALEKDGFRVNLIKAKACLEQRDLKLAQEAALAAIKENNQSLDARTTLATIYMEAASLEKAQGVLSKSLLMAPEHPPFFALQGRLALLSGKWEEASNHFGKSLEINAEQQIALTGMIVSDLLLNRPLEAKKRVVRLSPGMVKHIHNYSMDLARNSHLNEAELVMQQILKLLPIQKDAYKVWLNLGLQAKRVHNIKKALTFFKASASAAPGPYEKALAQIREIENLMKKSGAA